MQLKALALCIAVSTMFVAHAHAEDGVPPADTDKIKVTSGEQIYKSVCQGCHMPDGKGAAGAGRYPSLANNGNLEYPEYAIFVITYGQKAMPAMGDILTDQQIADRAIEFTGRINDPSDLETVARDAGLTVSESDFFGREDPVPGLGVAPQVAIAAFQLVDNQVRRRFPRREARCS